MLSKFKPAKFHQSKKNTYIDYYVLNPENKKLVRKKIKLNHISKSEQLKFARKLIKEINEKLYSGWNPFLGESKEILPSINIFLKLKEKELRKASIKTYNKHCKHLINWLIRKKIKFLDDFSKIQASQFLDELYFSGLTEVSWNRSLSFYKTLWNFFVRRGYTKINPFNNFHKKKEKQKIRIMIDDYTLNLIFSYLQDNNQTYLFYCYLTYYCFVRPKEICELRIMNFDFANNLLTIPGNISKNRKTQKVTLPYKIVELAIALKLDRLPKDYFICSLKLKPGNKKIDPRYIAKFWYKMRNIFAFSKQYQFYSLKDTGIVKMLQAGVSPVAVRDQARHYSLEVTNIYVNIALSSANQQILEKVNF